MMRLSIKTIITVLLVVLLAGPVMAGDMVVLKFATIEPPQADNVKNVWKPYFAKLNQEGKGVIRVDTFAGGTLGRNPTQQIKILENGVADMVQIINAYAQSGRLADEMVVATPMVAKNCVDCSLGVQDMQQKGVIRGYDNLVILGQVCLSQYGIHTNYPVKVPADLKGKKIRTAGKMFHALAVEFGATPVAMPVTKVAESISRGVVDGTFQDWTGMAVFRINDVAKYHVMVPMGTNLITVAMTKKKYNSLPAGAKALIDKYKGPPFTKFWAQRLAERIEEIKAKIKKDPKHHIYQPNAQEMQKWKAAIQPVLAKWDKEIPNWKMLSAAFKEGVKKAQAK